MVTMVKQQRRTDRCFLSLGSNSVTLVQFPAQRWPHPSAQHQNQHQHQQQAEDEGEPSEKRRRSEEALTNQHAAPESCDQTGSESCSAEDGDQGAPQSSEDNRAELASLKVTIQRSSESREFGDTSTDRLTCHLCHCTCSSTQLFEQHMFGTQHQRRLQQITESIQSSATANTANNTPGWRCGSSQRWCDVCQTHFSGDIIIHRRTQQHKDQKKSCRPFCGVCRRHFRNPRKFVEHMKSPQHKHQVLLEKAEDEEMITVDAVGCFENEHDSEKQPGDSKKQPGDSEKQPGDSEKQPGDAEKQPGDSEKQPEDSEKRQGGSEKRPGDSAKRPEDSEKRPGDSEKRPGDSEKQPGDSEKRPCDSEKQPGDSEKQPGDSDSEKQPGEGRKDTERGKETGGSEEGIDAEEEGINLEDPEMGTTEGSDLHISLDPYVIPVSGFLCRLCHKFFRETSTRDQHCSTTTHLNKLQNVRHKAEDVSLS